MQAWIQQHLAKHLSQAPLQSHLHDHKVQRTWCCNATSEEAVKAFRIAKSKVLLVAVIRRHGRNPQFHREPACLSPRVGIFPLCQVAEEEKTECELRNCIVFLHTQHTYFLILVFLLLPKMPSSQKNLGHCGLRNS